MQQNLQLQSIQKASSVFKKLLQLLFERRNSNSKIHNWSFRLITGLFMIISSAMYSQMALESFESGIPATWSKFQNSFGTSVWTTIPDGYLGGSAAYINPAADNIGAGNTAEYYLVTPSVTAPSNGEIRFYTKQGSATNNGTIYQLRLSTASQPDINGFTIVLQSWTEAQLNTNATTYEEKIVALPASIPAGLNFYLAFVAVNAQTGATASGDSWYVDNVRIISSCQKVVSTNFTTSNISAYGANLSWTHPSATNFQIQVLPHKEEPQLERVHLLQTVIMLQVCRKTLLMMCILKQFVMLLLRVIGQVLFHLKLN